MAHEVDFHPPREPFFAYGNNNVVVTCFVVLLFRLSVLAVNYLV